MKGTYIKDIAKMPLVAISVMVIAALGVFFRVPLLIPSFGASLFMIILREGSEFAHVKNVFGGHLIAFGFAFIEPLVAGYITFVPEVFASVLLIGVAVLGSGLTMAFFNLEHPPAIATTILFFGIAKEGTLLFGAVPVQALIPFFLALLLVSGIAYFTFDKK